VSSGSALPCALLPCLLLWVLELDLWLVFDLVLSLDVDLVLILEGEWPRPREAKGGALGVGGLGPAEPGACIGRWNLVCLLEVIIMYYYLCIFMGFYYYLIFMVYYYYYFDFYGLLLFSDFYFLLLLLLLSGWVDLKLCSCFSGMEYTLVLILQVFLVVWRRICGGILCWMVLLNTHCCCMI
jgi:hypothetical protein